MKRRADRTAAGGKSVLVFQRSILKRDRDEMAGIAAYARDAGWTVQTVEYGSATVNRFHGAMGEDRRDIRALLAFWRPDGCIVECGGEPPDLEPDIFGAVPTVFLDCPPCVGGRRVACVSSDAASIAACAARELLALGFRDYAFVPWPKDTAWNRERGAAFARLLAQNGKRGHVFAAPAGANAAAWMQRLANWLAALPKPCGVFAANDWCAGQTVGACQSRQIAVPDAVAVVGVDNDADLCEGAHVSITSVATDNRRAGERAAALLADRMAGVADAPAAVTFGVAGLARRASTRRLRATDARVARALEHIRRHACEGLDAAGAVAVMGCSRRWAEVRFRETTGRSILDEIHDVRFTRACDLLRKSALSLDAVARACGYASPSFFRKHFKERTGLTPRAWRGGKERP